MTPTYRRRILSRDIAKAEGTMDDFLRCYAKLRERAESLGDTDVMNDLNRAVLYARDLILSSKSARDALDSKVQNAINMTRFLRNAVKNGLPSGMPE